MALPMLERYSLDQAIRFIKNKTGETVSKEDLLEYAITGSLKLAMTIDVHMGYLSKIGSIECNSRLIKLSNWQSPILHSDQFPMWGNPKSFLHKQIAFFSDSYVGIDINLPLPKEYKEPRQEVIDLWIKSKVMTQEQISSYIEEDKKQHYKRDEELRFETRDSDEPNFSKISWLLNGKMSLKGYVYIPPYILDKFKTVVQDNETIITDVFNEFYFETVEFPQSKIKAYLCFNLDYTDDRLLELDSDEECDKATSCSASVNDLIILKDDLLRFVEASSLNLDNALYLLAEVINAVKSKNKKWTQSAIIDEILTQRQGKSITGLEQRTIEEYFSSANKRIKAQ
ncbi:hypothetical protein NYR88_02500 [Actinobacillus equuli subsp. haemolyticus]|nr:hypothetical protein NYR88_02500 [Actinobacillus equuli subsp. haemolyticus]